MMFAAKVVADSAWTGVRLTTMEVTFPKFILAEFNTHRMLSRCSASSRAIPIEKMLASVMDNPFVPSVIGRNKRGMAATDYLEGDELLHAQKRILVLRDRAVEAVREMMAEGNIHKQTANRYLEPWLWTTVVVSATTWRNFFTRRVSKLAQPEMRRIAEMMLAAYRASTPVDRALHLPYYAESTGSDDIDRLLKASAGRCARVSYLRQGESWTLEEDIQLCNDTLIARGHLSPLEHPAFTSNSSHWRGNFEPPWQQLRSMVYREECFPSDEIDLSDIP